jgi:hypothetical protein
MTKSSSYPDDENGAVLRRLEEGGDDLTQPRNIDFEHVFPSKEGALFFAAQVVNHTDDVKVAWFEDEQVWNVTVTRYMIPKHGAVTELENSLAEIARLHGGETDGWGCFGVSTNGH